MTCCAARAKASARSFIIDREGIIRYIDVHDIDQQPDNNELRAVIRRIDPEAAARRRGEKAAEDAPCRTAGS